MELKRCWHTKHFLRTKFLIIFIYSWNFIEIHGSKRLKINIFIDAAERCCRHRVSMHILLYPFLIWEENWSSILRSVVVDLNVSNCFLEMQLDGISELIRHDGTFIISQIFLKVIFLLLVSNSKKSRLITMVQHSFRLLTVFEYKWRFLGVGVQFVRGKQFYACASTVSGNVDIASRNHNRIFSSLRIEKDGN